MELQVQIEDKNNYKEIKNQIICDVEMQGFNYGSLLLEYYSGTQPLVIK